MEGKIAKSTIIVIKKVALALALLGYVLLASVGLYIDPKRTLNNLRE